MTATSPCPTRVDFHHHLFPTGELAESVRGAVGADAGWRFPAGASRWTPQTSLAFMDVLGIQLAVLSLPNDVESTLPTAHRRAFARQINTIARQTVDDHPGRFGFFAHLPTPTDVDAALEELTYALDELDADGVTLTNVYGTGRRPGLWATTSSSRCGPNSIGAMRWCSYTASRHRDATGCQIGFCRRP
jgi:predicted TIM-barrel fold metal-dependent hydrolase